MAVPTLTPSIHLTHLTGGSVVIPTVTIYEFSVSSGIYRLLGAGGDWVYDESDTNTQSDDNWLMAYGQTSSVINMYPMSWDIDANSLTENSSWTHGNFSSGGTLDASMHQMQLDRFGMGRRHNTGGFRGDINLFDLNAGLTGFDNYTQIYSAGGFYSLACRLDDTYIYLGSSGYLQGNVLASYAGGASYIRSAVSLSGYPYGGWAHSAPGSASGTYGNHGTPRTMIGLNTGSGTSASFGEGTTEVGIFYIAWNGSSGASLTGAQNSSVITLPTHTGSTVSPKIIATTWGNALLHADSATPGNSCIYPITWSGSTPTAGSPVTWTGGVDVPAHQIKFDTLDTVGMYEGLGKYSSGYYRSGNTDVVRTVRIYASGSDMVLDTITIDLSTPTGPHPVTVKQTAAVTFTGSSSSTLDMMFMNNDKDLLVYHTDTNKVVFIKDAYY